MGFQLARLPPPPSLYLCLLCFPPGMLFSYIRPVLRPWSFLGQPSVPWGCGAFRENAAALTILSSALWHFHFWQNLWFLILEGEWPFLVPYCLLWIILVSKTGSYLPECRGCTLHISESHQTQNLTHIGYTVNAHCMIHLI